MGAFANNININVNAKRYHVRTHHVYHHHRRYHSSWHYLHYHGNRKYRYGNNPTNLWNRDKEHWVLVKHNVSVKNISTKGTDGAHAYSIGTKILKKGSIVKGYYPLFSPSGFNILKSAKGFHFNKKYEIKHEATWTVFPRANSYRGFCSNYWMKAVK